MVRCLSHPLASSSRGKSSSPTPRRLAPSRAGRPEGSTTSLKLVETAAPPTGQSIASSCRRPAQPCGRRSRSPSRWPPPPTYDYAIFTHADAPRRPTPRDWNGLLPSNAGGEPSNAAWPCAGSAIATISGDAPAYEGEMGGHTLRDGRTVTIITGTLDYGPGPAAPCAQGAHDQLGVPVRPRPPAAGDIEH